MANGDGIPRIPGFMIGGGVALSNTAIVVGALAALGLAWLAMNNSRRPATGMMMDDESLAQEVEQDIMAYAASPTTIHTNRDRIRAAINAIRDTFRTARENYSKKVRDLVAAKRAGTITQAQFREQHKAALTEFRAAIRARHKEIMEELGIPHFSANIADITPTVV